MGQEATAAAGGSPEVGGVAVDEVVAEHWYEYESRESGSGGGGGWVGDAPIPRAGAGTQAAGGAGERRAARGGAAVVTVVAGRKEDVRLPEGGGWRWDGDWSVVVAAGRTDAQGWEYRSDGEGEGALWWVGQQTGRRGLCGVRSCHEELRVLRVRNCLGSLVGEPGWAGWF